MFNNSYLYGNNPYAVQYQPQVQAQQQMQQPQNSSQQTFNSNNGIIWVQGESGAKGYLIAPNTSLLLMDSEGDYFYIKTTDNTGMPTLRKFEYSEIFADGQKTQKNGSKNGAEIDLTKYVTWEQFEQEMAKIKPKTNTKKAIEKEVE